MGYARRAVVHSGLQHRVEFICSSAKDSISHIRKIVSDRSAQQPVSRSSTGIDLLLIDHDKSLYYSDLLLFEQAELITPGAIVVSDNVLSFGSPKQDLLDHVRDPARYSSSVLHVSALEYTARSVLLAASNSDYHTDKTDNLSESDIETLKELQAAEELLCDTSDGVEVSVR